MMRTVVIRTIMRRPAVVPGMVWAVVRPTRAHPAIDPVQKSIQFFGNPIELVRRIVRLPVRPPFPGRRHHTDRNQLKYFNHNWTVVPITGQW